MRAEYWRAVALVWGGDMSSRNANDAPVFKLPEILDVGAADTLKQDLSEVFSDSGQVIIDGCQVERIATPAVQLLLAVANDCDVQDRSFALKNPSQSVICAFEDLGLSKQLQRWSSC